MDRPHFARPIPVRPPQPPQPTVVVPDWMARCELAEESDAMSVSHLLILTVEEPDSRPDRICQTSRCAAQTAFRSPVELESAVVQRAKFALRESLPPPEVPK